MTTHLLNVHQSFYWCLTFSRKVVSPQRSISPIGGSRVTISQGSGSPQMGRRSPSPIQRSSSPIKQVLTGSGHAGACNPIGVGVRPITACTTHNVHTVQPGGGTQVRGSRRSGSPNAMVNNGLLDGHTLPDEFRPKSPYGNVSMTITSSGIPQSYIQGGRMSPSGVGRGRMSPQGMTT